MLLGRERELEAVGRLMDAARRGRSGALAIVGEPGIGKSSLLAAAADLAAGMVVLRARGVESEASIPFAGLSELLRPVLDCLPALPAPQARALESALALRPAQAHERLAVGTATLSLLAAAAAERPVAVLVDDAHWLDGSSADALRFAMRRLLAEPVAVVLTAREGLPSPAEGADVAVLRLDGLALEEATELVRRRAPDWPASAVARLHHDTGGNPLALVELARGDPPAGTPLDTPAPVTTKVSAAYLARVQAMPERTWRALVAAAAIDGGELRVIARALAALGLASADLEPAEQDGLLALHPGRVEFRHPLVRSAIYGAALPHQRRAVHRALADALPDVEADRRAWHLALAAAGPDERAASALEQAGQRARERSAYDVASQAFERAALLAPGEEARARLTYRAADAAWLAGLADRASGLLDHAARLPGPARMRIDVDRLRGQIALRSGDIAHARVILLGAAERAAAVAPDVAVVMFAEAAEGAFFAGDADGMRACAERAGVLATNDGGPEAFFARVTDGMASIFAGRPEGPGAVRNAIGLVERAEDLGDDPRLLAWAAMAPLWLREAGMGDRLVQTALEAVRSRSAAGALPHLLVHLGIADAASDRWMQARATFDEAIRLARETGQRAILAGALARLAAIEGRCGREDRCRALAGEGLALARELGAGLFAIWAMAALADAELARGNAVAALGQLEARQEALERSGIADPDLSPAPERIETLLRLDRGDEARAVAEPFVQAARSKAQPWSLARALRCTALLARDQDCTMDFEAALAAHARTTDVFETARTELAYGARLRRSGRRLLAREPLRAAIARFDHLGATPWADAAEAELRATGETARRRDPSTLDDLTPQELKVALLLSGGRTTREAAATLFLSPKTVEYHLRNTYRKLGVRTREELADAMARR